MQRSLPLLLPPAAPPKRGARGDSGALPELWARVEAFRAARPHTSPTTMGERQENDLDPSGSGEGASPPSSPHVLRSKIKKLERSHAKADWGVVPFGAAEVDAHLPGGGLPRGRLHEIAGEGLERELPATATGFAAVLAEKAARASGAAGGNIAAGHIAAGNIVWALARDDLHVPGLVGFGLDSDRLILARADRDDEILAVMEDALRTRGVAAVVGEVGALDLVAGKRLALACEHGGATAFALRRRLHGARRGEMRDEGSAAVTRWRVGPAPPVAPSEARDDRGSGRPPPFLSAPRWTARLTRCRGGRPGAWIMETCDDASRWSLDRGREEGAPGDVRVVAGLADHEAPSPDGRRPGRAARARDHGDGRERPASRRG